MTQKQKRKLAKKIIELEAVRNNENSSAAAIQDAEKQIMQITRMITSNKDGIQLLMEIDELIQQQI